MSDDAGKVLIICPSCNQRFSGTLPQPEIVNGLKASFAVGTHEAPIRCLCGQEFIALMNSVQVTWVMQPMVQTEPSRIITPPHGLKIARG